MVTTISLIVTTFNRASLLRRALESVALTKDFSSYAELLVVDNNSSDNTKEFCLKFFEENRNLTARYIFEPKQGLSFARNRGLKEAFGEYIVFMDDDQEIDPNYIPNLVRAFACTGASCVGGKIIYKNAESLPKWLEPMIETVGQIDLGSEVLNLNERNQFLKGGNIAFRRSNLIALGGFNVALGRMGDSLGAAEEDEIQGRMIAMGQRVAYVPWLIQYNWLLPEKFSKNYWRKQAYWYGKTQFILSNEAWKAANMWFGVPRSIYGMLGFRFVQYLSTLCRFRFASLFNRERSLLEALGLFVAALKK